MEHSSGISKAEKTMHDAGEHWYVMNSYTKVDSCVDAVLNSCHGLRSYMPKRYAVRNYYGRVKRVLIPLIPQTFFLRGTYEAVEAFQKNISFIGFATTQIDGRRTSMKVPDGQMESFMRVADHYEEDLTYYQPSEIQLHKGEYVKVVGGSYDGVTGMMLRLKGKRGKRLVACIPQIMAIATTLIEPEYIQRISKEEYEQSMTECLWE